MKLKLFFIAALSLFFPFFGVVPAFASVDFNQSALYWNSAAHQLFFNTDTDISGSGYQFTFIKIPSNSAFFPYQHVGFSCTSTVCSDLSINLASFSNAINYNGNAVIEVCDHNFNACKDSQVFHYTYASVQIPPNTNPTLDPSAVQGITDATGSIPTTASSMVLSSFENALPLILLVIGLYVSYRLIKKFMGRSEGESNGWIDSDGNISDPDIWEEMGDKNGQADIWQSDFDENGKIDPNAYALHWESNIADIEVFNPEAPKEPTDWIESAGGIEQHFADQGKDDTFYGGK